MNRRSFLAAAGASAVPASGAVVNHGEGETDTRAVSLRLELSEGSDQSNTHVAVGNDSAADLLASVAVDAENFPAGELPSLELEPGEQSATGAGGSPPADLPNEVTLSVTLSFSD